MIFPFTLLVTLSNCVYVDLYGSDKIDCGIRSPPCRFLSHTINNVSRPDDKICVISSPIKQIRYCLEKPIVISYSLSVAKSSLSSMNPVITYRINVKNNWDESYAFKSYRTGDADEMLSLKIKSVNLNVNIFTALSEGKRYPSSLSITNSIVNSPNYAVHLTGLSGYENVSIHVKDSITENGKKELFMFKEGSLKFNDILIENVPFDNIKSQVKALSLTYSSAMDIQNVLIKNCKGQRSISLHQTFTVFLV